MMYGRLPAIAFSLKRRNSLFKWPKHHQQRQLPRGQWARTATPGAPIFGNGRHQGRELHISDKLIKAPDHSQSVIIGNC